MPMTMQHERENVYRVERARHLAAAANFEHCQGRAALTRSRRVGPVRLLFVLEAFEGWEPHDDWHDLSFYVSYGDAIERIAIVGDERWRSESLMFAMRRPAEGARGVLFAGAARRRARLAVGLSSHQKRDE